MELWAGAECTVNRVGDRVYDQLRLSGFDGRLDDIDRLASLGISRMRFPLLWERTVDKDGEFNWRWTDGRLERLKVRGVRPIAGLLHHGSGPPTTHLLDPAFPRHLETYARAVAQRYPHIDAYTPVNEPLTTARFSALYGLWYPHARDDRSFVRALMNQIRGTVLAMRAIREVNPEAMLVQTEDLGFTTATPELQYQADFENLRRWLTFDLLMGRVGPMHGLWAYLCRAGASPLELAELVEHPCAPQIVGINAYVTSERHLDSRVHLYPGVLAGGNGRHHYADVEAARVAGVTSGGFEARLREAGKRYDAPLALTEVHLGCTREEQVRWLGEAWHSAARVASEGFDVRAVTCWAAFGSFDWDSLVTRAQGHYEPGLWDVRSDPPRATALVDFSRKLASGADPQEPLLDTSGWWRRQETIHARHAGAQAQTFPLGARVLVITGANGTLAQAFVRLCAQRGLACLPLNREQMDIGDTASVQAVLNKWHPWGVINAAGYVRVDDAQHDCHQWRENATGPAVLARACARQCIPLVTFSSDLVFDGHVHLPYVESNVPRPLSAYGQAKRQAELDVLVAAPDALIIRTAAFFGPWDPHNFVTLGLQALRAGKCWTAASDQFVSPTYVPDLVHATLDLLVDRERGIWHLANRGTLSWVQLAQLAARLSGLDERLLRGKPSALLGQRAPRPAYSALASERGLLMPTVEDAVERYLLEASRTT